LALLGFPTLVYVVQCANVFASCFCAENDRKQLRTGISSLVERLTPPGCVSAASIPSNFIGETNLFEEIGGPFFLQGCCCRGAAPSVLQIGTGVLLCYCHSPSRPSGALKRSVSHSDAVGHQSGRIAAIAQGQLDSSSSSAASAS
jgi:hypothetical protein